MNGAFCSNAGDGNYQCLCLEGYTGRRCEVVGRYNLVKLAEPEHLTSHIAFDLGSFHLGLMRFALIFDERVYTETNTCKDRVPV